MAVPGCLVMVVEVVSLVVSLVVLLDWAALEAGDRAGDAVGGVLEEGWGWCSSLGIGGCEWLVCRCYPS